MHCAGRQRKTPIKWQTQFMHEKIVGCIFQFFTIPYGQTAVLEVIQSGNQQQTYF
jgi:hypothetical protein